MQEAKIAREASEQRAVQLEAEVQQLKKDLERVRTSYADLYLESHSTIERLRRTELRAAQLMRQKEGGELDRLSEEAFEALEQVGKRQLEVERRLREFEQALATILDVLRPSDALRHELSGHLQNLRNSVESSLKPLSLVARRGDGSVTGQGCGVVAVNDNLQIMLLDRGSLFGMRPGARYRLERGGETVATVMVIEVRSEFSAAVLVEGTLEDVVVGSVMLPESNAGSLDKAK